MKPTTNTQTVKTQGVQSSVSFGIKQSGFAHIFNVLRNQLYSDKVLAVVREYSCNAVDAHVAAGKPNTPIKVTLPNRLNPNLLIRDYGDALSDEDIKNIYAFYGESTKRNTNDQIGMLGIGSKAAFAYGDNFVINSFINGKKHSYNAFIDPSQVGQISKLDVSNTDEADGIEIVVPVRDDDYDEFVSRAKDLFEHFPVKPKICGTSEFLYENDEVLFSGDDWKWLVKEDRYGDAIAVMGNIAYPIERYSLNLKDENEKLNNLLKPNLVMVFNIGDLEISASREKLQFTNKTKDAIIARMKVIEEQVVEKAMEQFGECESMFAAKCLYGSMMDWTSGLYEFRDILSKKLTWNGVKISSDHYYFDDEDVDPHGYSSKPVRADLVVYEKPNRGFKYRAVKKSRINCTNKVVVIENDLSSKNGMIGRVLPLAIDQNKTVYMFTFSGDAAKKTFLKKNAFDAEMVLASTLEKKKVSDYYATSSSSTNNSSAHSSKHSTSVFEVDWDLIKEEKSNGGYWRNKTKSAYFSCTEVDLENDKGVYVIIDRFLVQKGSSQYEPWDLQTFKDDVKKIGLDFPEKIYAIKTKFAAKVEENPDMINLWDWAAARIEDIISEENLAQKVVDYEEAKAHLGSDWAKEELLENIGEYLVDPDGDFSKFLTIATDMLDKQNYKKYMSLANICVEMIGRTRTDKILKVKPSHNVRKLRDAIEEKYAMLNLLDSWSFKRSKGGQQGAFKDVANYINVVDVASL